MTRELSPQQRRVMALVANGMQNKHIVEELGITMSTVKSHLAKAFILLDAANRTQAAIAFRARPK